jgi:hypothetical protein
LHRSAVAGNAGSDGDWKALESPPYDTDLAMRQPQKFKPTKTCHPKPGSLPCRQSVGGKRGFFMKHTISFLPAIKTNASRAVTVKGKKSSSSNDSGLNFEAQLWAAADKMRWHMDASEYKHVCLGLIFLKYITDAFEEKREQLLFGFSNPTSEWFIKDEPEREDAAENRDEYLAANVFWLPPEARWHTIKAKSPEIGKVIDDTMGAIERENPTFKGVLPRDYARPSLDKVRLSGLVNCMVALPGQLFYSAIKCSLHYRMVHWMKRLNILGRFAELWSQGAQTSRSIKT